MRIASVAFAASAKASFCITAFALGTRFARSSVVVIALRVLWHSAINDLELQGDIVRKDAAAIETGEDAIPWFRVPLASAPRGGKIRQASNTTAPHCNHDFGFH